MIDERIAQARRAVLDAKSNLKSVIASVRPICSHPRVAEIPWKSLKWCGSLEPRRICMACGLEEAGSRWSGGHTWSKDDFSPSSLGNTEGREIIIIDDRDQFYAMRVD